MDLVADVHARRDAAGRVLGVVGLGQIGREVARIVEALGMRIVYTNTTAPAAGVPWELASFDEIVERTDAISLHCPLISETRHLVDREVLRAMKAIASRQHVLGSRGGRSRAGGGARVR